MCFASRARIGSFALAVAAVTSIGKAGLALASVLPPSTAANSTEALAQVIAISFNSQTHQNELRYVDPTTGTSTVIAAVSFDGGAWKPNTFSANPTSRTIYVESAGNTIYSFSQDAHAGPTNSLPGFALLMPRKDGKLIGYTALYKAPNTTVSFFVVDAESGIATPLSSDVLPIAGIRFFTQTVDFLKGRILFQAANNDLYIFDSNSSTISNPIPLGVAYTSIGVLQDGSIVGVGNPSSGSFDLRSIDSSTGQSTVIAPMPFKSYVAGAFAVDQDSDLVYMVDGTNTIFTIDGKTGQTKYATKLDTSIQALALAGCYDSDQDGLCDIWETKGLAVQTSDRGVVMLDLPHMGANPLHKDIFVHVDYMAAAGHSHKPDVNGIDRVVKAFANAPMENPDNESGIALHVDCGPDCNMYSAKGQAPVKWGTCGTPLSTACSKSIGVQEAPVLGISTSGVYDWTAFDQIRSLNFANKGKYGKAQEREQVFRYALFAHEYPSTPACSSGIARDVPSSDFLVSLGCFKDQVGQPVGTEKIQSGTFMHELGHTLGLRHGGTDNDNYKPHYLSVMSYAFQFSGVLKGGAGQGPSGSELDYSQAALDLLDENQLSENDGLNGWSLLSQYWTRYFCDPQLPPNPATDLHQAFAGSGIDWNCKNGIEAGSATVNINGDYSNPLPLVFLPRKTELKGASDWDKLAYRGGAVGNAAGNTYTPPATTALVAEATPNDVAPVKMMYDVRVDGYNYIRIGKGQTRNVRFRIVNDGTQPDSYSVTVGISRNAGYVDLSSVPAEASLKAGESVSISIPVSVPRNNVAEPDRQGNVLSFNMVVASKTQSLSPAVGGGLSVDVFVPSGVTGDFNGDGVVDLDDLGVIQKSLNVSVDNNDPRDLNFDGRIDAVDARLLTTLCDKPRCAR